MAGKLSEAPDEMAGIATENEFGSTSSEKLISPAKDDDLAGDFSAANA